MMSRLAPDHLDGDPNVSITIREVKDLPGKEIVLTFEHSKYEILLDNRCLGKDTKACNKCKLKFRCYTGDALRINFDEEIAKMPLPSKRPTLGEVIQWYLRSKGVEPSLTSLKACAKMIENEERKETKRGSRKKQSKNEIPL